MPWPQNASKLGKLIFNYRKNDRLTAPGAYLIFKI